MRIAIYKYTSVPYDGECEGKISRVHILPDNKTDGECKKAVEEYNACQAEQTVTVMDVSGPIEQVIEWSLKDRRLDVRQHIEILEDIKSQISDIEDYLYSSISDIKSRIEKEKN